MAALAQMLVASGAAVTGSDTSEVFYTDALLSSVNTTVLSGFRTENIPNDVDAVVYSAAYDPSSHVEIVAAAERKLPLLTYAEALGELSEHTYAVGISGVHGKTTTTSMAAVLVKALGLPGRALVGGGVSDLGGSATLIQGEEFLVAETDEYRRHFLHFHPNVIVITSVEADHLDYFGNAAGVHDAFAEYARTLPPDGTLYYCADDEGAARVAAQAAAERPSLQVVGYGESATCAGAVSEVAARDGNLHFHLDATPYDVPIPGRHNALNAAAALLVARHLWDATATGGGDEQFDQLAKHALSHFAGSRRRSELVGEAGGVIVVDDYGHHPTAIAATIAGYREFYPGRRVVLDFMPHTYSRTLALLNEFAESLATADVVVLHDIYASAREENPGNVTGKVLADATATHASNTTYIAGVLEALPVVEQLVRPGDLFVTMGAGSNWQLGVKLIERLRELEAKS